MEPKREDKRKKKRKKQRQAMLAKAIPVVIAIVLIIALVGIFYGETLIESVYYTSEREDLYQYFGLVESDDVAMIMQDAHIDEKAKLVDGNCYFDKPVIDRTGNVISFWLPPTQTSTGFSVAVWNTSDISLQ